MARLIHVDALIVGDGSVVRDAAVVVEGAHIVDVGAANEVIGRSAGVVIERLHGVVMPGLINAHAHIELSSMRGKAPPGQGFVVWLEALQRARVDEMEETRDAAIGAAIDDLVRFGVVGVGEVTNTLSAWKALASRGLFGAIFHELLGIDRASGLRRLAATHEQRERSDPGGTRFRYAPSPHALYSTHPDLVTALVGRAAAARLPITVHLAEHPAERAFLRDGTGPMRRYLESIGLSEALELFPPPKADPIAYAASLGLVRKDAALVHLTDARVDELDRVAEAHAIAVLCPRSNLHIETALPPLLALRARGVTFAIGTDSLASTPSLDPLGEARALRDRFSSVPPLSLVSAAMHAGARAIGWGDTLGLVERGRAPGLLHVASTVQLADDVDAATWLLADLTRPRRLVAAAEPMSREVQS